MRYTLCLILLLSAGFASRAEAAAASSPTPTTGSGSSSAPSGAITIADAVAKKQSDVQKDRDTVSGDQSTVNQYQLRVNYDQTTTVFAPSCLGCAVGTQVPFCQKNPQQCQTDNANLSAAQQQLSSDQQTYTQDSQQLIQLQTMLSGAPPPPDPAQTDAISGAAGPTPALQLSGGGLDVYAAQRGGGRTRAVNLNPDAQDLAKLQGPISEEAQAAPTSFQAASMLASLMSRKPAGPDMLNTRVAVPTYEAAAGSPAASLVRAAESKLMIGDFRGALADSQNAIKADPKDPRGYQRAGQAYTKLKDYQDAEGMARQTLALDPNNAEAWQDLALALVLAKQGRYKEALEAALTAVRLNPNLAPAWAIAAYAAGKLGDPDARRRYLEKAAGLDPKYQDAANGDDDDLLLGEGKPRSQKAPPSGAPWGFAVAGALLALAAVGGGFSFWKLKRAKAAAPPQIVHLAAPGMTPVPGAQMIGKFRVVAPLGRGSMGEVFSAVDVQLGRPVAIKKLDRDLIAGALASAQVRHPSIVGIYEILEAGDDLFIVSELVKGKTLRKVLAESGRLPARTVSEIIRPVCEALECAHARQLAHGGLKPENIMITEEGYVKLMDLGVARGTKEADVLALGAMLRELAAPHPAVDALVSRAFSSEPGQRFTSAAELGAALRTALG